ncbi:MAG: CHAT domain-containing protein [Cyclobacteriaceae bacterium]|nr:CHAT domain-containing protein [Cyclobacteriaceae bacterium]
MNLSYTYRAFNSIICASALCILLTSFTTTSTTTNLKQGSFYLKQGDEHFENNSFEDALNDFNQSALWFKKTNNFDSLAIVEVRIAKTWLMLGEYQKGKTLLERLTTDRKIADNTASEAWFVLAECYFYLSDPWAAIDAYLKSRDFYRQIKEISPMREAHMEMSMGNVYRYELFDFQTALKHYFNALNMIQESNEDRQEEMVFWCYYNIAGTYRSRLQPEQAANYSDLLIKMANENQSAQQLEYAYTLSANIAVVRKNYPQALQLYKKIIDSIESGKIKNEHLYLTGMENLASVYLRLRQPDSALYWVKKARTYLGAEQKTNYVAYSNLHELMAGILEASGNKTAAMHEARQGLQVATEHLGQHHPQRAKMQNILARLSLDKQDYSNALIYSQNALATVSGSASIDHAYQNPQLSALKADHLNFNILLHKGTAMMHLAASDKNIGLLNASQETFLLADSIAERTLQTSLLESDKVMFVTESMQLYEPALQVAMQLYTQQKNEDQLQIILHWMEKNKSRILQKAIYEAQQVNRTGVPDSLIRRQYDISRQLNQLAHRSNSNDSLQYFRVQLLQELEQLQQNIESQYSNYALFSQGLPTQQVYRLQQYAKDHKKAIIQFFTGTKHIYILGIWASGIKAHQLPINEEFSNSVRGLLQSLHVLPKTDGASFNIFTENALYLFEKLLHPVMDDLELFQQSVQGLHIIPDGLLAGIPFECLLIEKTTSEATDYRSLNYLIGNFDISYALASGLLNSVSDEKLNAIVQRAGVFAYTHLEGLAPLPNGLPEARMIRKYMPSTLYLEKDASLPAFREKARDFDLLHLAIHGQWDTLQQNIPYLLFQPDKTSDGLLQINDLYSMELSSRLAILSACETGIGTLEDGEGVISIARGFFYAGCPAVIMSLGKIHDHNALSLMEGMYTYLIQEKGVDFALSQAKRDWLASADEYTAHPGFWSSMVLMGAPGALQFSNSKPILKNTAKTGLFLLLFLLSAFWIYRKRSEKNRLVHTSATTATND